MVDDVLRMRTTISTEESLAAMRAWGREIGMLPQKVKPHVNDLNRTFATLGKSIQGVGREITAVVPALSGFGLGAAGVAVAAGALLKTFSDTAKRVVELSEASKELGISERELRAWGGAAERVGISAQSMQAGLLGFKKVTDGLRYQSAERNELFAKGFGPVIERIRAARTETEKLTIAWETKKQLEDEDPSGFKARWFLDTMGIGADKMRLSLEDVIRLRIKLKDQTPEEHAAAKAYADSLHDLGDAWDHLVIKGGVKLFPWLTETVKDVEDLIDAVERAATATGRLRPAGAPPILQGAADIAPGAPGLMLKGFKWLLEYHEKRAADEKWMEDKRKRGTLSGDWDPELEKRGTPQRFTDMPLGKHQDFLDALAFPDATGQIEDRRGEGDPSSKQRIIKGGVFEALVDFQSYVQAGGAGGGAQFFAGGGGMIGAGAFGAGSPIGGFRPGRGGGGALGTGSGGGERFGVEAKDLGWYHQMQPQGEEALFKAREKFNEELKDPKVRDLFAARMASEVGGQGEEGAQKFGEEVLNRALAREPGHGGGTLREALEGKDAYYPSVMNYGIGTSEENRTRFNDIISKSMGSNLIKWGTGNASGTVGFGRGGFETSRVAGGDGAGGDVSGVMGGVNPRLLAVAQAGAKYLPPGYTLRPVSGARSAGYGYHPSGQASDWQIYDPKGNPIANRGDDVTGLYTTWARGAYTEALKNDPELAKRLGWGGAFGTVPGGSTPDLMHLDLGGHRGLLRPGNILSNLGPFSTRRIDEHINGDGQKAEGQVHVSINSNGTAAQARTRTKGGLFQKTTIQNQRQMQPTSEPVGPVLE